LYELFPVICSFFLITPYAGAYEVVGFIFTTKMARMDVIQSEVINVMCNSTVNASVVEVFLDSAPP
jgi:hypothetical protein